VSTKIKIVSVVGARPQFVKLGAVARSLEKTEFIDHKVIHTGQHYDERMSDVFFDELQLPRPDANLDVGSGGHGVQTAAMLAKLEEAFGTLNPGAVIVYGDTNSTLAATLAATKLHIPVVHIEAGLRSFNRLMPEEINRLVADHCSDRLYAPTPTAIQNLHNENLADRSVLSGDVMRDTVLHYRELARSNSRAIEKHRLEPGRFGLLTIHRPINTTRQGLLKILSSLEGCCSADRPLVFPVHPRTRSLVFALGYRDSPLFRVIEPVAYLDMLQLLESASIIVTDSGGVQKEAAFLQTPCITLREETEWTETVDIGVNRLVGQSDGEIRKAFDDMNGRCDLFNDDVVKKLDHHYGIGGAADTIVGDFCKWLISTR